MRYNLGEIAKEDLERIRHYHRARESEHYLARLCALLVGTLAIIAHRSSSAPYPLHLGNHSAQWAEMRMKKARFAARPPDRSRRTLP